jgi:hypothetical protein
VNALFGVKSRDPTLQCAGGGAATDNDAGDPFTLPSGQFIKRASPWLQNQLSVRAVAGLYDLLVGMVKLSAIDVSVGDGDDVIINWQRGSRQLVNRSTGNGESP